MFDIELSVGDFGGHAVLAMYGELDLFGTSDFVSHLIAAVAAYGPSIIVDLAGLNSIGSCGLGVLVRALRWTREGGGDLSLAAPQQQVHRVLEGTGLIDVFCVYPSVAQAVRSAGLARSLPSGTVSRAVERRDVRLHDGRSPMRYRRG
jgi:anti-anti-sigma factor